MVGTAGERSVVEKGDICNILNHTESKLKNKNKKMIHYIYNSFLHLVIFPQSTVYAGYLSIVVHSEFSH